MPITNSNGNSPPKKPPEIALNFNDDNDKYRENRKLNKNKKKRVTINHKCGHPCYYPERAKFDYTIKNQICPACEEWENPAQQEDYTGTVT